MKTQLSQEPHFAAVGEVAPGTQLHSAVTPTPGTATLPGRHLWPARAEAHTPDPVKAGTE